MTDLNRTAQLWRQASNSIPTKDLVDVHHTGGGGKPTKKKTTKKSTSAKTLLPPVQPAKQKKTQHPAPVQPAKQRKTQHPAPVQPAKTLLPPVQPAKQRKTQHPAAFSFASFFPWLTAAHPKKQQKKTQQHNKLT